MLVKTHTFHDPRRRSRQRRDPQLPAIFTKCSRCSHLLDQTRVWLGQTKSRSIEGTSVWWLHRLHFAKVATKSAWRRKSPLEQRWRSGVDSELGRAIDRGGHDRSRRVGAATVAVRGVRRKPQLAATNTPACGYSSRRKANAVAHGRGEPVWQKPLLPNRETPTNSPFEPLRDNYCYSRRV